MHPFHDYFAHKTYSQHFIWNQNRCKFDMFCVKFQFLTGRRDPLWMISWQKEWIKTPQQLKKVKLVHRSVQFSLHAVTFLWSFPNVFLPSLSGSFASFSLFSLLCWKALLGSNLRRAAPGSFDFNCSRSLLCRFTWDWSFDISYKQNKKKDEAQVLEPETERVWGLDSRQCCSCVSPVLGWYSHLSASSHVWSSASGFDGQADGHKHQITCLTPPGLLHFHWEVHLALLQMHWAVPMGTNQPSLFTHFF